MSPSACPRCGARVSDFDPACPACGAPLATSPAPDAAQRPAPGAGETVSHFRILQELGRGGMGVVYRALDLELKREVALKFLAPRLASEASSRVRLQREALAAAALDHPNIGTIYEIGEHEGRPFLALALYEGETLADRLRRLGSGLPLAETGAIAFQLASALAAAHRAGIVHRDLKPSNVFLTSDGRVKLLDFGLARQEGSSDLTEEGRAAGTGAYMAPERLLGRESGPPADLWSLGVVLYEALAGRKPFGAEGEAGLVDAILSREPGPLPKGTGAVGPEEAETERRLRALVEILLSKDPRRRPASADEVCDELRTLGFAPGSSGAGTLSRGLRRPISGRARLLAVAAGVALLLLGGWIGWARWPSPPLTVAVAPARIDSGAATEDGTDGAGALAANVETAALRALAALDGVTALDPRQLAPIEGTLLEQARAVAAGEILSADAACRGDLCQLTLRRLGADRGRVLWTQTLQISAGSVLLTSEAVSSAVRRAYSERRLLRPLPDIEASEETYSRYLRLILALDARTRPPKSILAEAAEIQRQAPDFLAAYTLEAALSAEIYETSHDPKLLARGLEAAQRARERAPGDPRPLAARFDLLLAAGRTKEAAPLLAELEKVEVSASDLLLRRARLAERQGNLKTATTRMRALVDQRPSWRHLLDLALLEARQGRLAEARAHLEALLRRYPGQRQALATLGSLELLQGNPERGVSLLRDLDRRSPSVETATNLGVGLLLVRRYGEAEFPLRRAFALAPGNPVVALNLADALQLSGHLPQARELYAKVVAEVDAESATTPHAWLSVAAQALAHLGEPRRAVTLIQRALRAAPDDAGVAFEAALVYALVGDRASAVVQAERAVASGVEASWFRFSWFDPLRTDPSFARLIPAESSGGG